MSGVVSVTFREVDPVADAEALVVFLCAHEWPFHVHRRPDRAKVEAMAFGPPATQSFWIEDAGARVGLIRLEGLDDFVLGCPSFDLRIATPHRGRGLGRRAVDFAAGRLFRDHPAAHRLEAYTRIDNLGMRRVLEHCGFTLEGRIRETWPRDDGDRVDTALYGLLRREHTARSGTPSPPPAAGPASNVSPRP